MADDGPTNADRAERANVALDAYVIHMDGSRRDDIDDLTDLLCDLMHLVKSGIRETRGFDDALATARSTFESEEADEDAVNCAKCGLEVEQQDAINGEYCSVECCDADQEKEP